jgi:hypothetical protein
MNWFFHKVTTATNKMQTNWLEQGQNMLYKITYLMKLYSIPLCLVVNNDQTRICLILIATERTWESKGTKHIQVLRVEDKKQVSMLVFFVTNGCYFLNKLYL